MTDLSRRQILALGGAAGVTALLAGCSGGGGGGGNSGSKNLRVWFVQDSVSDESIAWLKSEYKKKVGGTLSVEIQQWDGIVGKLTTALASEDSTPDIVELGNTQAAEFCAVGALSDLSDLKKDLGGSNLTKSLVDSGSFDGKMYAAPFYAGSRVFFYRKDFFEEAGVKVPTTIDELTDTIITVQQKKAADPNFSALFLPGIASQASYSWLFTEGGRLATGKEGSWKGGYSSEESIKAYTILQKIWKEGTRSAGVTDTTQAQQIYLPFNQNQSAMFFGFPQHMAKVDQALKDQGKVGNFAFPPKEAGGKGHPFAGGSNVAISAKSKNQDNAKEAMKLIFSAEFQNGFGKNGWVPGNLKYASSLGSDELSKIEIESVKNSVATPAAKNWALVEGNKVTDNFTVAVAGGGDIKSLAADADKKLADLLNKK